MISKKTKLLIAATLVTFFNIGVFFAFNIQQFLADRFLAYFDITPQDIEHIETNICTATTLVSIFMGLIIKWTSASTICMLANYGLFLVSIIFFVAVDKLNFNAILFFTYIRGICTEGIFLGQATLTVDLFAGQGLSLMIGMAQVANSLTAAISSTLIPKVFLWSRNIPFCFFLGAMVSSLGVFLTLIWQVLDIYGWGKEIAISHDDDEEGEEEAGEGPKDAIKNHAEVEDGKNAPKTKSYEKLEVSEKSKADNPYYDLLDLNIWLNCLNYAIANTNEVIFKTFANELFVRRFGANIEEAGLIVAIIPLITIPFTPMYSAISMKYGKGTLLIMFGYATAALSFIYMSFLPQKLDSIWQLAPPLLVYAQLLSISHAFLYANIGVVASSRIVSIALSFSSLSFGVIYITETKLFGIYLKPDTAAVYQTSLLIIATLHVVGLLVSLLVFWIDMRRGKVLYLPESSPEAREIKKKINKGYKWFKENYLKKKRRKAARGGSKLRSASSTNYTLNNRLLSSEKKDGGLLVTVSDQNQVAQHEADKDSKN